MSEHQKMELPGGESNPALARPEWMTGACTKPIYYQGHVSSARSANVDTVPGVRCPLLGFHLNALAGTGQTSE
jgi:hypothetical protein